MLPLVIISVEDYKERRLQRSLSSVICTISRNDRAQRVGGKNKGNNTLNFIYLFIYFFVAEGRLYWLHGA